MPINVSESRGGLAPGCLSVARHVLTARVRLGRGSRQYLESAEEDKLDVYSREHGSAAVLPRSYPPGCPSLSVFVPAKLKNDVK